MDLVNNKVFEGEYTSRYREAAPFPHIVLENLWQPDYLQRLVREVKAFEFFDGQKEFYGASRKKYCSTYDRLPELTRTLIDFCHGPEFIAMLERMTGEESLVPDPYLHGAGIHRILPGGFLRIHADFNWHRQLAKYRRLNLLVYLNPDWEERWGGELQLWRTNMSGCEVSVFPKLNTTVLFTTDDTSFHGHPNPLGCPIGVSRDSIALYYYSAKRPQDHSRKERELSDYRARGRADIEMTLAKAAQRLRAIAGRK